MSALLRCTAPSDATWRVFIASRETDAAGLSWYALAHGMLVDDEVWSAHANEVAEAAGY